MQTFISLVSSLLLSGSGSLRFHSLESKSIHGNPVINEISFEHKNGKDIWSMKQTHDSEEPDELAIIVDLNSKKTTFHQRKNNKEVAPRVNCFYCHANGPRAIRPIEATAKLRAIPFNLRIKSYGKLEDGRPINPNHTLQVKSCIGCHNPEGMFARGHLTREQFMTIGFMVREGHMPPLGHPISDEDRLIIEKFISGL
jgi:hypothetical protein